MGRKSTQILILILFVAASRHNAPTFAARQSKPFAPPPHNCAGAGLVCATAQFTFACNRAKHELLSNCKQLFAAVCCVDGWITRPHNAATKLKCCCAIAGGLFASSRIAMEKRKRAETFPLFHSAAAAALPPPAGKARAPAQSRAGEGRNEIHSTNFDFFRYRRVAVGSGT